MDKDLLSELNIWEEYPHIGMISKFKTFKRKEGKDKSSRILIAVFLIFDPKSPFRKASMTEDEIMNEVNKSVLKDVKFPWDEYEEIKEYFLEKNGSKLQMMFRDTEAEIINLNTFLKKWKLNKNDVGERAKVMKQYRDLYKDYMELKEKIDMEVEDGANSHGDYDKSMLENM